jgi:DNA modification methylase
MITPYYEEQGITIYNGDCLDVMKELEPKSIDLILTDPPYVVGAKGCGLAGNRKYLKDITSANIDKGFDIQIFSLLTELNKAPNLIIFSSKEQIDLYIKEAKDNSLNWQLITWNKTNPTPLTNNNYLPDTEYIFHIWKDKKLGGNYDTKRKFYVTQIYKNDFDHPTVKPLEIISNLMINGSKENELILDPFMGSGTTLVAAKKLNRRAIGIEINKKYCDIAIERLSQQELFSGVA